MSNNQKNLENILVEMRQRLDQAGITFLLMHGTLLGCIRDKRLIPWDNDIDLGCLMNSEEVKHSIVSVIINMGYSVRVVEDGAWKGKCVIVGVTDVKDNCRSGNLSFSIKFITRIADGYVESGSAHVSHSLDSIKHIEQISFLGTKFHIPAKPQELFKQWYGEGWKTKARSVWIKKGIDNIEFYPDQKMGYRASGYEEALLKVDDNFEFVKPYEKVGQTTRTN